MWISLVHVDQNVNVCPIKIEDPAGKEFHTLSVVRPTTTAGNMRK